MRKPTKLGRHQLIQTTDRDLTNTHRCALLLTFIPLWRRLVLSAMLYDTQATRVTEEIPCFSPSRLPLTFHRRKSFEYEDAARLTMKQGPLGGKDSLCHAYSDDNIYEDIVCKSKTPVGYEPGRAFLCVSPRRMCLKLAEWARALFRMRQRQEVINTAGCLCSAPMPGNPLKMYLYCHDIACRAEC